MRSESTVHALWSAYGIGRGNASGDDVMLTGAMVLKRAMAVVALALPTSAIVGHTVGAAPAQTCVAETWVWTGSATLDSVALVFDTTVAVPVVAGTQLFVSGLSADGLAPDGHARALRLTIGGVIAVPGRTTPGGPIMVLSDGAPAEVRSATVLIDRCATVQVAAPVAGAPVEGAPVAGAGSASLPHTGVGMGGSMIGALAIAAGAGMMVLGRRRSAS